MEKEYLIQKINDHIIYTYEDIKKFGGREHLENLGFIIVELYHRTREGYEHNNLYQIFNQ
ncbi:MAG: hypothetical protein U0354_20960 [Candidatus Sericytochromatia bacterium]